MKKQSARLELNPNAFLLYNHTGLLDAATGGVRDVVVAQGFEPNVGLYGSEDAAKANSGLEFMMQDYRDSRQIDAREYLNWLELKSQLSDHQADRVMALTSHELTTSDREFVLGATSPDLRFSVISLAAILKSNASYSAQAKTVRHLARRQYAMIEGMPFDSETDSTQGDIRLFHSGGICTLDKITGMPEAIDRAGRLSNSQTAGFCAICIAKLRQSRVA